MKTLIKTVALALVVVVPAAMAIAQRGTGELEGVARQLDKPATESIEGKLLEVRTGPCEHTTGHSPIGTHLILMSGDHELNVHLGPATEVEGMVSQLQFGDTIDAKVFRTDRLAKNHYIAVNVKDKDQQFVLRDDSLRPVWAGAGRGRQRMRALEESGRAASTEAVPQLVSTTLHDPSSPIRLTQEQWDEVESILADANRRIYGVLNEAQTKSLKEISRAGKPTEQVAR